MSGTLDTRSRRKWQFGLRELLAFMFLAAAICAPAAYFGLWGIVGSLVVAAVVGATTLLARYTKHGVEFVIIVAGLALGAAMLLPAVGPSRETMRRSGCRAKLQILAMAMQSYLNEHGHFPPAYVADKNGAPLLSWRVLLLPYLNENQKFKSVHLDEPWDGPNNAQLADCPDVFQCPSDPGVKQDPQATSYVVVTGPGTPFPGERTTSVMDFRDGLSNTFIIVEVANSGIHWMEPRDLSIQQMATTINAPAGQGISSAHAGCVMVAFADGHVRFLPQTIAAETLRGLLTINGGEIVEGEF